jgi:hypothetical protein
MVSWQPLGNATGLMRQRYPRNMKGLRVLAYSNMLYYNINMSHNHDHHGHHHHHHPGGVHPPASVHPSILRMSVLQRLGFAVGLIALVWIAAFWAMR